MAAGVGDAVLRLTLAFPGLEDAIVFVVLCFDGRASANHLEAGLIGPPAFAIQAVGQNETIEVSVVIVVTKRRHETGIGEIETKPGRFLGEPEIALIDELAIG